MYGGIMLGLVLWGLMLLVPLAIVVLLIVLVAKKSKGEPEEFPNKMRTIYNYMVMVVSLIVSITGFVLTWTNVVDLFLPAESGVSGNHITGLITSIATILVGGTVFALHAKNVKKK